jgi:hypothetical protein
MGALSHIAELIALALAVFVLSNTLVRWQIHTFTQRHEQMQRTQTTAGPANLSKMAHRRGPATMLH